MSLAKKIAELALETFDSLPQKCKPRTLANGQKEWTPMSAVVLSRPIPPFSLSTDIELKIVSLATGTKSLPVSALPKCNGLILHDCHAEILAFRGLNCWLLCEIENMLQNNTDSSPWLQLDHASHKSSAALPPCSIRPGVEIHLFSTEAPCGDASMELLMASSQAAGADTSPWELPASQSTADQTSDRVALPHGRGYFSNLGALRRKPARADAEISMSKSCTDKIMLKQFTSLVQFPVNLFLKLTREGFLKDVIVYENQYNESDYKRAFAAGGRLGLLVPSDVSDLEEGPIFFNVHRLPADFRRFEFEKQRTSSVRNKVTNISAVWLGTDSLRGGQEHIEALVNGVRQGFKQFDRRIGKASALCRYNLLRRAIGIGRMLQDRGFPPPLPLVAALPLYSELKMGSRSGELSSRKDKVLSQLGGWPEIALKDDFEIADILSGRQQQSTHSR